MEFCSVGEFGEESVFAIDVAESAVMSCDRDGDGDGDRLAVFCPIDPCLECAVDGVGNAIVFPGALAVLGEVVLPFGAKFSEVVEVACELCEVGGAVEGGEVVAHVVADLGEVGGKGLTGTGLGLLLGHLFFS